MSSETPPLDAEPERPDPVRSARRVPRSCELCNRRKVRCDKKEPCSPCARAGKSCVFPPTARAARRPKRTIMADMAGRIASLEKSLAQATDGSESYRSTPRAPMSDGAGSSPLDSAEPATPAAMVERRRPGQDILLQKGSSSQYFNEVLLSRVIEEERDIQSVLTTPNSTLTQAAVCTCPFNPAGILSSPSGMQAASSFHPTKAQALKLWSLYIDNVESCTGLKVLHIPTDEIRVYTTINGPEKAPSENLALCFAVYFAALVSVSDVEAELLLGQGKIQALSIFKLGLEQSLAQADFLDNPTLAGLNAVAIYLGVLRVHNRSKGIWILNGLAIRIAQSLGLHRDGEDLGLSPFEAEIRRRLWWHFVVRDGRAGEDYGLQGTVNLSQIDVRKPLNLEDSDIYPGMKELPAEREGWTPLTFSLINIDIANYMQTLDAIVTSSTKADPPREEVRARIMGELKAKVEKRLQLCNPVIPRHRLTMLVPRLVLRKIDFITRQEWQLKRCPSSRESFATEENLAEAVETLELGLTVVTDDMMKPFGWSTRAYPQYHMTLYILWHLCVKPEGPSVERAWEAVEHAFVGEMGDGMKEEALGAKATVLRLLKAKAELLRNKIHGPDTRSEVQGIDDNAALAKDGVPGIPVSWTYPVVNGGELDLNMDECPSWETLVQGFQLDGDHGGFPNIFWQ